MPEISGLPGDGAHRKTVINLWSEYDAGVIGQSQPSHESTIEVTGLNELPAGKSSKDRLDKKNISMQRSFTGCLIA